MTYGSRWERRRYKWLNSICVDNGYPPPKRKYTYTFCKRKYAAFLCRICIQQMVNVLAHMWLHLNSRHGSMAKLCRKGIGSCLFIKNKHGHPGGQRPFFCIKSGDVTFNRKPDTCYFWCGYMAIIRWAGSCSQQLFGVSWSHCIKSFWYGILFSASTYLSPLLPQLCSVFGDMGS